VTETRRATPDRPSARSLDSLSDQHARAQLDPHDMMGLVLKFPNQCREAIAVRWRFAAGRNESEAQEIRNIVVTGLGGSAIGGDFVRCLADEHGAAPLIVNRDYTLPHWVSASTLVIVGSYSGNTEETRAAYAAAVASGAQVAVVTSGGTLREKALIDGYPVAIVPGGQPPRSATGYMFFPMLNFLANRGLLAHDYTADMAETLAKLTELSGRLGPEVPTADNPAKQLALALHGKLPVIYGSQGYRGAAAYRWKSQFNENAKEAAFANVLPEQNHNEILAWELARRQAQTWSVVFLRDRGEAAESPRIARRVEVTKALLSGVADVHEIYAEGVSLLTRLFSLAYIADFVTVYVAYLNAICPTDIGAIDHLKTEMEKLS